MRCLSGVIADLHLSTACGSCVAGVMCAYSLYRHEFWADVESFRSILWVLFFLAVGMVLDVHAVLSRPLFVFGIAAMLVVTKAAIIFGLACLFGMEKKQAFSLGLLLSQGGE